MSDTRPKMLLFRQVDPCIAIWTSAYLSTWLMETCGRVVHGSEPWDCPPTFKKPCCIIFTLSSFSPYVNLKSHVQSAKPVISRLPKQLMLTIDSLQNFSLFEDLSTDDLAHLLPHIHKRAVARGVYLFYPSSPISNTYLVVSGLVRLFFTNAHGQEFLLNLVRPGKVFGLPVLQEDQVRLLGASAYQDSVVLCIASGQLLEYMPAMPRLGINLYREASTSARDLLIHARALVTLPLNARLAFLLLRISQTWQTGDCMDLPINQTELGDWLGASRGRVNRTLNELENLDLIRREGNARILVLDRAGLEGLAKEET